LAYTDADYVRVLACAAQLAPTLNAWIDAEIAATGGSDGAHDEDDDDFDDDEMLAVAGTLTVGLATGGGALTSVGAHPLPPHTSRAMLGVCAAHLCSHWLNECVKRALTGTSAPLLGVRMVAPMAYAVMRLTVRQIV
jgi:hypothetical protein